MKKQRENSFNLLRQLFKNWHKGSIMFLLFGVVIFLSAWSYLNDPVETGAYQFVYPANFGNRINIPADNPTTKQGVYLGRMLFYETRLSANNIISCGSCHQQDKAFTDGKTFSEGVDQVPTPRNAMSLANLLWARKFFWDGRVEGLEAQAIVPMTNPHEMGQSLEALVKKIGGDAEYHTLFKLVYGDEGITGERIAKAIAQFERTLISCNSKYDQYLAGKYQPTPQELTGMQLFMDGRFKTLAEVVDHYNDHIVESPSLSTFLRGESNEAGGKALKLSIEEKKDIVAFLNMLTDNTFITDPRFADPHKLRAKN